MFKLSHLKWFVVVITLMILSLATVSAAFASSVAGNQNPDLTVTASLTSNGANPDQAAVGNTVTLSLSIENNTKSKLTIQKTLNMTVPISPYGRPINVTVQETLAGGQIDAHTFSFSDVSSLPTGTFHLQVAASDRQGTSSATATITFV